MVGLSEPVRGRDSSKKGINYVLRVDLTPCVPTALVLIYLVAKLKFSVRNVEGVSGL